MIRLQDSTPAVYYDQSRDFQFIGRLFDVVLNSVRTNTSNITCLPVDKNMNEGLLNLLSTTLGFQSKHNYNSKQLEALCSVLPTVLRNKGSIQAVLCAVNALLGAEGITQSLDYTVSSKKEITLYLPEYLSDLTLLRDLLVYILPAGMGCQMVKEISETVKVETNLTTEDVIAFHESYGEADPVGYGKVAKLKDPDILRSLTNPVAGYARGVLANTSIVNTGVKKPDPESSESNDNSND